MLPRRIHITCGLKPFPVLWGIAIASMMPVTTLAETIEEVETRLLEAYSNLQSFSARLKDVEDVPLTAGDYMKSDTDGTVKWMRKRDKILYRMEIKGRSSQKFGANENNVEQTSTLVCDGELFHTLGEQLGYKRYIKQKPDSSINGDFRSMLDMVRKDNNVRLVPDEKIDGADCYVVEITPKVKPADDDPMFRTLAWFRKDIGLSVRVASFNKSGKEVHSHTLLDLKINVPIDAAQFVPPPVPEGVEVTDLTGIDENPTTNAPSTP